MIPLDVKEEYDQRCALFELEGHRLTKETRKRLLSEAWREVRGTCRELSLNAPITSDEGSTPLSEFIADSQRIPTVTTRREKKGNYRYTRIIKVEICKQCGNPFEYLTKKAGGRIAVTCSRACRSEYFSMNRKKVPTEELIKAYLSGGSTITVAGLFGMSQSAVSTRLKKAGVLRPMRTSKALMRPLLTCIETGCLRKRGTKGRRCRLHQRLYIARLRREYMRRTYKPRGIGRGKWIRTPEQKAKNRIIGVLYGGRKKKSALR